MANKRPLPPVRQAIIDALNDGQQVIFLDGDYLDQAIVGLIERFGQPQLVCYDYHKVIKAFIKQGMAPDEAIEWFDFNCIGAWMGELTPVFLHKVKR